MTAKSLILRGKPWLKFKRHTPQEQSKHERLR
jgi:hypothetical protein